MVRDAGGRRPARGLTHATARWWPLRVAGGRLVVPRAVLTPEGLSGRGRLFPWGAFSAGHLPDVSPLEPPAGWSVDVLLVPFLGFAQVTALAVAERDGGAAAARTRITPLAVGPYVFAAHRITALNALCSFLRDEPRARAALAEPARLVALLGALRATVEVRSGAPREPLLGDAYDLHHAAARAYRAAFPRRYLDRRVDVDPVPPVADLVAAVRLQLPARLRDRFGDDEIAERVARFVARPPWPFGVLLDGPG